MRELILIRHGLTTWNEAKRLQGRTDVELSEAGISQVRGWRLPPDYREIPWYVSPLGRTAHTARLLELDVREPVDALIEMDWGEWTGRRLADLRSELGEKMAANERRGLDFNPPGGESPREVRARLAGWIESLGPGGGPVGAITHKGVLRAAISLATGWDLKTDYGEKLERDAMHRFALEAGTLRLIRLNLPL